MAYSVIDKVYTIFIDVMTGSSNGYGKPTFYNTDSHTSFIELTVTNGSKEFNMTEFSYMFTVEKPDGTKYTNEYTTQDRSKLVIPVDAQMISCTGNCNAQLYVNKEVDGVNKTLTMVEFNYTVYKGLHEGLISESVDFDNVYVKILNKLDYIINNGADLTGDQAAQLSYAYQHSQSPHAPANIVETMHTEIGEAIDAHHKKVALSASQVGSYKGTNITIKPSQEGLTNNLEIWGRTIQNLCTNPLFGVSGSHTNEETDTYIMSTSKDATYCYVYMNIMDGSMFKVNKEYSIIFDRADGGNSTLISMIRLEYEDGTFDDVRAIGETGKITMKCVPSKKVKLFRLFCYATQNEIVVGAWVKLNKEIMILEGDYTQPNSYIPSYFKGIKSAGEPTPEGGTKIVYGSCGKNLLNTNFEVGTLAGGNAIIDPQIFRTRDFIKVKSNTKYVFSSNNGSNSIVKVFYDKNKKWINDDVTNSNTFTTPSNCEHIKLRSFLADNQLDWINASHILEEGTEATAYEPYQEDIKEVTANISDGLKGLTTTVADAVYFDRVRQEIWSKQMVGVYTFTGDEVLSTSAGEPQPNTFHVVLKASVIKCKKSSSLICNNLPNHEVYNKDRAGIYCHINGDIVIAVSKGWLETPDLEGFRKWLKANPTTIYFELENPKYTKISSSNTNLKTFVGTTHVFSKNDVKPSIFFGLDFVPMTTDTKQFCSTNSNKNFILPDVTSLQDSNALEIHLFVKMLANVTLSFPSNVLWNDLAKMNEVTKGSTAEFVFTYIKTAEGGSWLGTVVPHK